MSLIVQNDNPKLILEKCFSILKNYDFETKSYRKILDQILLYLKNNNKFDTRDFLKLLPKELAVSFDTAYLFPMPSFADEDKYMQEVEKVSGELRIIFLKNTIMKISENLKKGEKDEDHKITEDLEKELASVIGLLGKS